MDDVARKPCPFCGEAIAATATRCRFCRSDLNGSDDERAATVRWGWIAAFILGGIFLLVVLVAGRTNHISETEQLREEAASAPHVDAGLLLAEYEANEIAADQKYGDRLIVVSGRISSIGKDILNNPYLVLSRESGDLSGVQCSFDDEDGLASLTKGASVTVGGRCSGKFMNVQLRDCQLVR